MSPTTTIWRWVQVARSKFKVISMCLWILKEEYCESWNKRPPPPQMSISIQIFSRFFLNTKHILEWEIYPDISLVISINNALNKKQHFKNCRNNHGYRPWEAGCRKNGIPTVICPQIWYHFSHFRGGVLDTIFLTSVGKKWIDNNRARLQKNANFLVDIQLRLLLLEQKLGINASE